MRSSRISCAIKHSTLTYTPLRRIPTIHQRQCAQPQQRYLSNTPTPPSANSSPSNPSSAEPTPHSAESTSPTPPPPQSLSNKTHYHLFPHLGPSSIPPSGPFTLNLSTLKKDFFALQSQHHPDHLPADQKHKSQSASAIINDAYKTLSNPLLRAQYLLSLRGIDVAGDETAKVEDPELLMEVLETREVIEEAETEEELVGLREANETRVEGSVGVLEEAFARDDLEAAREEAVKLRYWINIRESIDGWERGKPVVLEH